MNIVDVPEQQIQYVEFAMTKNKECIIKYSFGWG